MGTYGSGYYRPRQRQGLPFEPIGSHSRCKNAWSAAQSVEVATFLMNKSHAKTDEGFRAFIKERDESLLSLDEERIRAYAAKYNVKMPEEERVFWAGVHKARCQIASIPEEEKQKSREWLKANGFQESTF
jgi:hypothetical protein